MKPLAATLAACLLLILPAAAQPQSRTRRTAPTQRRGTTPAPTGRLDQTKLNAVRLQTAELVKDQTRFLYVYGRLSKDLELTTGQASSADVTARAKSSLLDSIRAMRDRLEQFERQFRFTPGLEQKYRLIEGVSRSADDAARQAEANRFDQAGRTLLEISTRLTDALIEL
ncbi:MAG TPA: hypothetical protein VEY09_13555 [Pyrinomonadaceae bacterium]|nr:hypothetical protein [Pyrinomonadaceae bacterium]